MEIMKNLSEGLEVILEESLVRRRAGRLSRTSSTSSNSTTGEEIMTETENMDGQEDSVVNFDHNGGGAFREFGQFAVDLGAAILENENIQNVVSAVVNDQDAENLKEKLLSGVSFPQSGKSHQEDSSHSRGFGKGEVEHIKFDMDEEADEEVIELEFERAVHMLHTHNMYCPKCRSRITKVIVRRRKVKKQVPTPTSTRGDLFGCLSCFSIFSSEGHRLNPFRLWTKPEAPEQPPESLYPSPEAGTVQNNQGRGFDCFGLFGTGEEGSPKGPSEDVNKATSQGQTDEAVDNKTLQKLGNEFKTSLPGSLMTGASTIPIPEKPGQIHGDLDDGTFQKPGNKLGTTLPESSVPKEIIIPIPEKPETDVSESSPLLDDVTNVEKPEIIRSIIYGGLTESITSLSVITSAAASDATTLNIIALGLANLIGGLFVIGQNLLDLKNDQQVNRYQELLGQKKHFLLHATFAILSYLVFGLVPPVVYGFTFRETDDRDFKLLAVAAASLICIVILAIGKAYIQGRPHKFSTYLKTVLYYLTTAIMASGVGFAVGDLVKEFMEKLGWFDSNQAGTILFAGSQPQHPSFAS